MQFFFSAVIELTGSNRQLRSLAIAGYEEGGRDDGGFVVSPRDGSDDGY
jgi:hypothetical protein